MEYIVKVEKTDYDNYVKYVRQSLSPKAHTDFWKNLILWFVIGIVGVTIKNLLGVRAHFHVPTALLTLSGIVVFYVFNATQYRKRVVPPENGFVLGDRTYIVDDSGLRDVRPNYESRAGWESIVGLGETAGQVFLMLDNMAGYIIPTSKMSTQDNEALRTFLKAKVANKAL